MRTVTNLTGQTFGRLTALEHVASDIKTKNSMWACQCICGERVTVAASRLTCGRTKSCGCYRRDWASEHARTNANLAASRLKQAGQTKHGLWQTYASIRTRCENPRHPSYRTHGRRGITCNLKDFAAFKRAVQRLGEKPSPEHTLDRIDNDGPYSASNLRWASKSEQSFNRKPRRSASEVFLSKLSSTAQVAYVEA